jgi:hypothetical protein
MTRGAVSTTAPAPARATISAFPHAEGEGAEPTGGARHPRRPLTATPAAPPCACHHLNALKAHLTAWPHDQTHA